MLSVVGQGKSCLRLQEDAQALVDDGFMNRGLAVLSGLGGGGQHMQNAERDLHRRIKKLQQLKLAPLSVQTVRLIKSQGHVTESV